MKRAPGIDVAGRRRVCRVAEAHFRLGTIDHIRTAHVLLAALHGSASRGEAREALNRAIEAIDTEAALATR